MITHISCKILKCNIKFAKEKAPGAKEVLGIYWLVIQILCFFSYTALHR